MAFSRKNKRDIIDSGYHRWVRPEYTSNFWSYSLVIPKTPLYPCMQGGPSMTITFPLGSWKMKRSTTSGKYRSPRKLWRNTEQKWKKSIQGLLKRSLKQKPGKNERYEYIDIHITCLCSVEAAHIYLAGHVKRCTFFLRVLLLQGIEIVQIKGYPIVWDGIRCGQLYTPVCEV